MTEFDQEFSEREIAACTALGWFATLVANKGWQPCAYHVHGAIQDLNRFRESFSWDKSTNSFILRNV